MYGPHLIMEAYDAPKKKTSSVGHIYNTLDKFPDVIDMTKIMPPHVQKYSNLGDPAWGISGFVIIAESHIAIHTYPEKNFFALDIFSCKDFDIDKAIAYTIKRFNITDFKYRMLERGEHYPVDVPQSAAIVGSDRRILSPARRR